MAKIAIQSVVWDYTVNRIPVAPTMGAYVGRTVPNLFIHQREDNGVVLGHGTDDYGIIQNRELMDAARTALDARGMADFKQKILVTEGGKRFYGEFTFENKQLANAVGDVFGFRLVLVNSFDRSTRAAFKLGFLRLVCTNGMATMEKEFSVTQKHSAKLNLKFLGDAIDKALANGKDALAIYDELARCIITDEQGQNILKFLESKGDLSGVVREGVETLWLNPSRQEDKARNLYNLYNAATDYLTHQVEGERYEYANQVNSDLLYRFVNIGRNPLKFTEATTKIITGDEIALTIKPE